MYRLAETLDTDALITAASSLSERINGGQTETAQEPVNAEQNNQLFQTWLANTAQGDWKGFDQRLAWDGLDRDMAHRLVAWSRPTLGQTPFWANTLELMLDWLDGSDRLSLYPVDLNNASNSIPFADALLGLSAFGMNQLIGCIGSTSIGPVLHRSLERQLLERLSEVCDLTLGEEFLHFRKQTNSNAHETSEGNSQYREFTRTVRVRFPQLFAKYPVLGRLVATAILFWVDDLSEFLARLENDLPGIAETFFAGDQPDGVLNIDGLRSDPHANGRTVKVITFVGGRRLVYKPKSLAVDVAWNAFLEWMRIREPQIDIRSPKVWNRDTYGWVECIDQSPCESEAALNRFYHRAGMLACLLYMVQATDFHFENLIASGEDLVAIDLETLFSHEAVLSGNGGAAAEKSLRSVLRSGLMPNWQVIGKSNCAFDFSGLGSNCQDQPPARALGWQHLNTDQMRLGEIQTSIRHAENLPSFDGRAVNAGDFAEDVVAGFNTAYRALMRHRDELLGSGSPLQIFQLCDVRFVFRDTHIYTRMLRRSVVPRLLRNGVERSLEFELLARHLVSAEAEGCGNVFRAELAALEQLDVPYFTAKAGSDILTSHGAYPARQMLQGPSWPAVASQLNSMSESDREHQEEFIRASFHARTMRPPSGDAMRGSLPERLSTPTLSASSFIERASRIANELVKRAIPDENGALHWIGVDYLPGADRYSLRPLAPSLYGGLSGIALFFGALHSITGLADHRQTALRVARGIDALMFPRNLDSAARKRFALADGIGGACGLGSVVYSLVRLGSMINEPSLVDRASDIARLLTEDVIAADEQLDVVAGSAGTLFGLAALFSTTRDRELLDTMKLCGEHLVRSQGPSGGWPGTGELPLTGYSHGAAGIAYALLRLYELTGESSFLSAARKGIAYERSIYSDTRSNWPDLRECRTIGEAKFRMGWCHGAPGIGLARLGCLRVLKDAAWREDADRALRATNSQAAYPIDTVCCGEFGFADFFLVAAEELGEPSWREVARRRASEVVAAAERRHELTGRGYLLSGGVSNGTLSLGFFLGLAGIGYQLLRLAANPGQLPSVLLWE